MPGNPQKGQRSATHQSSLACRWRRGYVDIIHQIVHDHLIRELTLFVKPESEIFTNDRGRLVRTPIVADELPSDESLLRKVFDISLVESN